MVATTTVNGSSPSSSSSSSSMSSSASSSASSSSSSAAPSPSPSSSAAPIMSAKGWASVFLWMLLGYSMIFFNKMLFSTMDFAYPLFLTCWHCFYACVATQVLQRVRPALLPGVRDAKVTAAVIVTKVVPLSLFFAMGLVFGNTAYKYLSVAYIQMVKSGTPVMMLLMAFMIGRERVSVLQLAIVALISVGVAVASAGELHFSLVGFLLQLAAMCADVSRITLLETVLADFKLDSLSMLYYLSPSSAVLIAVGFFAKEYATFPFHRLTPAFCAVLFLNGSLAFALNLSIMFVISNASGMIMSIAGLAKDIIVVVTSSMMFHAPVTAVQYLGYSITVAGMFVYKDFKADPAKMQGWLVAQCPALGVLCVGAGGGGLGVGGAHHGGHKSKHSGDSLAAEEALEPSMLQSSPLLSHSVQQRGARQPSGDRGWTVSGGEDGGGGGGEGAHGGAGAGAGAGEGAGMGVDERFGRAAEALMGPLIGRFHAAMELVGLLKKAGGGGGGGGGGADSEAADALLHVRAGK